MDVCFSDRARMMGQGGNWGGIYHKRINKIFFNNTLERFTKLNSFISFLYITFYLTSSYFLNEAEHFSQSIPKNLCILSTSANKNIQNNSLFS